MTLDLFELLFLIWILYFMGIYLKEGSLGIVVLSLITISILYHDFRQSLFEMYRRRLRLYQGYWRQTFKKCLSNRFLPYFLDVRLTIRVFETMKYFEKRWWIEKIIKKR